MTRPALRLAVLPLLLGFLLLGGCSSTTWSGSRVQMGVRADTVSDLESRTVSRAIDADVVRIRNLAGRVTVISGDVEHVEVEATVYARGRGAEHTALLLDGMHWIESSDRDGRPEWTLSYPVQQHQAFHYSLDDPETRGFELTTTRSAYGREIMVTTRKVETVPTLFADIRITYPADTPLYVRNYGGSIEGADLRGTLDVRTAAGGVELGSFDGELRADTGAGDITVDAARGYCYLDTGSGDVTVLELHADADLDTGSGDITIHDASAGSVRADTGSGRITMRGGSVDRLVADTGSGDVEIEGVVFRSLHADTGSGDVTIHSPLSDAGRIHADTGSGDVTIVAGTDASFDLHASIGSGRLSVGYEDARLRHDGKYVIGAVRGEGGTWIHADTGSGDVTIRPAG